MSATVNLRTAGSFGTWTNDAYDRLVECERIVNLHLPDVKTFKGLRPFGSDIGKLSFPCVMFDIDGIEQQQHMTGKTWVWYTIEFWWFVLQPQSEDILKRSLEFAGFFQKLFSNDAIGELVHTYGSGGFGDGNYEGSPTYKYITNQPFWSDAEIKRITISKSFRSPFSTRPGVMRGGLFTVRLMDEVIK